MYIKGHQMTSSWREGRDELQMRIFVLAMLAWDRCVLKDELHVVWRRETRGVGLVGNIVRFAKFRRSQNRKTT